MKYRVPKREFEFVLREVLEVEQLTQFPIFEAATWSTSPGSPGPTRLVSTGWVRATNVTVSSE